jgi:CRISPR-associated endonuclease/helicase Cas3
MPVYSHSKENSDGEKEGSKLLIDHLRGVRDKALANYSERVSFSIQNNYHSLLENICWLHDLGKYTRYFQDYLLGTRKVEQRLKNHSSLGAHTAFNLLRTDPKNSLLAYYLIKLHHSNLMNFDDVMWPEHYNGSKWIIKETFKKQVDKLQKTEELKKYVSGIDKNVLKHTEPKVLFKLYKNELQGVDSVEFYFIINYLFSLLIESDKLDASNTDLYQLSSIPANEVDNRPGIGKPDYPDSDLSSFSQNELRNFVRSEVVKNIGRTDILQKRIFTLAAPTGIGKTLTALDFSLKLREKIESEEGYLTQIIYGLPFINIIEQALSEYEKTLGEGKILGHYQFADVFGRDKGTENSLDDVESFYSKKKMSWDTWQSDIVITSFVQLFETMIGNRNRLLKKFHHFADSIIILDEVQTLAIEKLPIIGATLYYLSKYLNTRVIIMTATQPKLFELMERELDVQLDEPNLKPFNLLERDSDVFSCFNRTKIVPLLEDKIEDDEFIELFESKWTPEKSCLIVVNKVKRSIEIFDLLKNYLRDFDAELFYLSTNITPIERNRRVDKIKKNLPNKTCILVSTQVVEAGVDLDFDMGFRDLGPIDSIVQVAGRINRENSGERMGSPLYVVDFGDCQKIYGYATDTKARLALKKEEIPENEYKKVVEHYFESVSDAELSGFEISKGVFEAMKNLRYGYSKSSSGKDYTVSDFRIIEDSQNGISVFVELPGDQEGTESRLAFQALINNETPLHEFESKYKRAFHQRIIAAPDYLPNVKELEKEENRLTEDILWIQSDVAEYYYDEQTGFIRKDAEEKMIMF